MIRRPREIIDRMRRPRPPGPRGTELARFFIDYQRNGLSSLERVLARHGDIVHAHLLTSEVFLFGHPDLIHHVLVAHRDIYLKVPPAKSAGRFFGNSMQLNNDDYARRMRRLLAPVFQPDRMAATFTDMIVRETQATLQRWGSGTHAGLTQELMDLALDITVQIHVGTAPGEETKRVGRAFLDAMSCLGNLMLPPWVPTPHNRRYHEAVARLDGEIMQRIRAGRSTGQGGPDMLSTFLHLTDAEGTRLSDQQIRDELVTMMSAGYQSVGIAIAQTLRLVAENREVDTRLAEELHDVVGSRAVTPTDLDRLTYADKVVKESLRLCPPAGVIVRRVMADDEVGGFVIPNGARVFLSAWAMHRDSRFYDDPLAFRPERWTPGFERALPMCAYFPFGRGPRSCIAGALSTLIVQLVLALVTQRHRLQALRETPASQASWPILLRDGGLQVDIQTRHLRG